MSNAKRIFEVSNAIGKMVDVSVMVGDEKGWKIEIIRPLRQVCFSLSELIWILLIGTERVIL